MKSIRRISMLVLALGFSMVAITSCDSLGTNSESDLYGIWNFDDVTIEITANGGDFVDLLVDEFGFTLENAEAQLDTMMMDLEAEISGTIEFKDDNTYNTQMTDDAPDNGTWTLSEDGITLTIVDSELDSETLTIDKLTSSSLIISLPTEEEDIDLDGDDVEETTLTLRFEMQLSKS